VAAASSTPAGIRLASAISIGCAATNTTALTSTITR